MVQGARLKKVTSAIASGESITSNNTSNTTVGAELTQINSDLTRKQDILGIGTYTGNIDYVSGQAGELPQTASICWVHSTEASGGQPVGVEYYILETYPVSVGIALQRATQFIYQGSPVVYTRMYANNAWDATWAKLN
jgi:hypothetical protein